MDKISLPDALRCIKKYEFLSSGLESINIPPGVIEIKSGAFRKCIKLVRVDLPNIETIEECMFMDCESLKQITIPNSITKIKKWAFSRCTSLENIVIAEQVYQIERNVFDGCTSLDNVHVPSNITKMEQSVFEQCTSLTRVKFDAKISTLPKQTFLDCSALECVDFTGADKIKRMRESCFQNCIHLRTIVLPPNLGFIEDSSFKA